MSRAPTIRLRRALPLAVLLATVCGPVAMATQPYRYWNHQHRKYDTCLEVRSDANNPEIRWADWNAVGSGYFAPTPS